MSRHIESERPVYRILAIAVLFLTYLIYRQGLTGPLLLDDFSTLIALGNGGGVEGWQDALRFVFGNSSGPSGRPVSVASFLLDGRDWPVDPAAFKHTNILLHLASGVLVGWFALLVFKVLDVPPATTFTLALVTAFFWLLHPLNVSTALYVVQRMTQLMALFSLAALVCYLKGMEMVVRRPMAGLFWLCAGLCPFGLLAVLSKENGALLLAAILVLELTIFSRHDHGTWHRWWLRLLVVLPLCLLLGYLALRFTALTQDFAYRPYSLWERVLTESRMLTGYLVDTVFPRTWTFGLYQDDRVISRGLVAPWTTALSVVVLALALLLAIRLRRRQPVFAFAVGWFFAWHLLESTFLPLEPYFEHRNYLPLAGVLLALVYYAHQLIQSKRVVNFKPALLLSFAALMIVFAGLTLQLTRLWGNAGALLQYWAENHPASSRAQLVYGDALAAAGEVESGYELVIKAQQIYPREATLLLHGWNFACEHDLQPTHSLPQITAMPDLEFRRDDINFQVRRLVEHLVTERCPVPPMDDVLALMSRLETLPMREYDRANFHFLFSDVYVYYRQLTPALVELRKTFDLRPTVDIPIRQAVLAASAGNFQDSLLFLERARMVDEARRWPTPSRRDEIEAMERDIRARVRQN